MHFSHVVCNFLTVCWSQKESHAIKLAACNTLCNLQPLGFVNSKVKKMATKNGEKSDENVQRAVEPQEPCGTTSF